MVPVTQKAQPLTSSGVVCLYQHNRQKDLYRVWEALPQLKRAEMMEGLSPEDCGLLSEEIEKRDQGNRPTGQKGG